MFKKIISFLFVPPFILVSVILIHSQEKPGSDTVVINDFSIPSDSGVIPAEKVDFKDASIWAHNKGFTLVADSPPVIDNKALILTQYQTIIPVSGYKKDLLYRIYFDFLRFKQSDIVINSKLKIFIRDIYGNKHQVGVADSSYMSYNKIFEVSVPFDLSYPGKFDIIIHEYSVKTGNWGVWDIIVTSKKLDEIELIPVESAEKMKEIESKIFK